MSALALIDLRTIRTFRELPAARDPHRRLGRAEAINYHNFEYKPQDAEAKYFLSQFCALYYRRNRYTIQDDFSKSLYFLDGKLANGILDTYRKDDIIRKFLTNTSRAEIDIDVKKVALEEMQNSALPRSRRFLHGLLLARRPQRDQARPLHRELRFRLQDQRAQRTDPHQSAGPDDHLFPRGPGIQMKAPSRNKVRRGRGRTPRNLGPTSARHIVPCAHALATTDATAQLIGHLPRYPRRASGGPPVLNGFPPAPPTEFPSRKNPGTSPSMISEKPYGCQRPHRHDCPPAGAGILALG